VFCTKSRFIGTIPIALFAPQAPLQGKLFTDRYTSHFLSFVVCRFSFLQFPISDFILPVHKNRNKQEFSFKTKKTPISIFNLLITRNLNRRLKCLRIQKKHSIVFQISFWSKRKHSNGTKILAGGFIAL